jgi:hypothetical protein
MKRRKQGVKRKRILSEIVGWLEGAQRRYPPWGTMGIAESILSLAEGLNPSYGSCRSKPSSAGCKSLINITYTGLGNNP